MRKVLAIFYLFYAGLIFITLMFIVLPFVLLASAILSTSNGKRIILTLLRIWASVFSLLSFFWIRVKNKKLVNRNVAHIYVGNHGSYLDAIAVCISIPQYFSPLGKIEMTKIPIFGLIYKRIVVMIDRSSKESREQSVVTLKNAISNGQSILIFPEGTMNKSDAPLGEFYEGAFRIAIETQTPIQAFVMLNNRNLLPRANPLNVHPGIITTVFLPAIGVADLTMADLPMLKQKVQQLMEAEIIKHEQSIL